MSKLEELIAELCPDGVKIKLIEELSSFRRGSFPQPYGNAEWYDGEGAMPFVQVADIGEDMKLVDNTKRKISCIAQPKSVFAPKGSIIISLQGSIGRIAITQYDAYIDRTVAIFQNISKELVPKYFVYQLQRIFAIKEKTARGSTIKTITKEEFTEFPIPVPPLPVQSEIVRILDNFTELTAELTAKLTAELTARKKQYEYYMEHLLNNKDDVLMEALGEIFSTVTDYVAAGSFASIAENVSYKSEPDYAQLVRTMDIKSSFTKGSNVYVDENAFKFLWRVNLNEESIIMPNIGVNCGEVYFVTPQDLPYDNNVLGPNAILLRSEKYNNKYLLYLLKTNTFQKALRIIISPGGQTKFNKTELKKLKLPIPSLEEQNRIVALLDRFDALCNDLTSGLPAEIEARQKQYEYYRDKLLTFKELS